MSLIRVLTFTAVLLSASVAFAAPKPPPITAKTVKLADDGKVSLTVKMDELQICNNAPCLLWLGESMSGSDASMLLNIDAEGAWLLSAENEHYSKEAKDDDDNILSCKDHTEATKAAAEDKDKEKEEEKDEDATPDESWKDKPILTVEERRAKHFEQNVRQKYCAEKAAGTLAGDGNERVLEIAADALPESDFFLWSNGHFGAYVGDLQVGSPHKTGGIKYDR